jgi:cytochrome c-type biogenesis protein CcmH/NrfG
MRAAGAVLVAVAIILTSSEARSGPVEEAAALSGKGKKAEAVALLEKAAEASPKDCAVAKALGNAYFEASDPDLGWLTFERFLKVCPKDPAFDEISRRVAKHFEQPAAAQAPVDEGPRTPIYVAPLPEPKMRGGGTEDDRWAYESSYTRVGSRLTPVEDAIELLRVKRYREAVATLEAHVEKKPRDEQGWLYLGTARFKGGDRDGAIAAYKKYLSLAPNAPDAEAIRKSLTQATR